MNTSLHALLRPRDRWNGWLAPFRTSWSANSGCREPSTLEQVNAPLGDFLPRFNAQSRVPAQQDQAVYRFLDSSLHLERILCFKYLRQVARDNTVKYQLRTLQLLPTQDRPSYAGVKVEVLERSDGQPMVQHEGKLIAHQEAPLKAGAMRAAQGAMAPTPEMTQVVRSFSHHGLTKKQLQRLVALGAPADQPAANEDEPTPYTPPPTQATPRKQALWKAVQHAKLQGVHLRAIARQLGISRNTVRKYIELPAPPINRTPRRITWSETQHHTNGHFH